MLVLSTMLLGLRVLTQNVRYAASPGFKGEAPWEERLPGLVTELHSHAAAVPDAFICLQEVLHHQLVGVLDGLNVDAPDEWASIGVGRDDGGTRGEYSPILYRRSVWALRQSRHFWLSETPDRPSRGWDASSTRIVTIGLFAHRQSEVEVVAMNTHLDDAGTAARENGALLIIDAARGYLNGSAVPGKGPLAVVLAGDMNSRPEQEAYRAFTASKSPFKDARVLTPPDHIHGPEGTFTGFDDGEQYDNYEKRLDYVFVAQPREDYAWSAVQYKTLSNMLDDRHRFSDHRAVRVDVQLLG